MDRIVVHQTGCHTQDRNEMFHRIGCCAYDFIYPACGTPYRWEIVRAI